MFQKISLVALCALFSFASFADIALTEVNSFGSNPGDIKMFYYAPKKVDPKAPLIVLLHGCTQSAAEFDDETGWTKYADTLGLYLMFPQQKEANNQSRCFNWFEPSENSRGNGEAASIIEMIEYMSKKFNIDSSRIFIAGLSAGAAMTSAMLANYPEVFAGGAIVAGIPYGCATNSTNAWTCMFATSFPAQTTQQRGDAVRKAAGNYQGPWPRVMVVHGTSDELVNYKNAQFHIDQWTNVYGTDNQPDTSYPVEAQQYQEFKKDGEIVAALLSVKNMKHGYPIDPKNGCGISGKYILDAGICSTKYIADFFKITK